MRADRDLVKCVAMTSMLVDHAGYILFQNNPVFRCVGRVAFPLFLFLLVDGYYRTADLERYGRRILICWALSIVPYGLAFFGTPVPGQQNVFATMFLCLCVLIITEREHVGMGGRLVSITALALLAEHFSFEYGWYAVALTVLFAQFRRAQLTSIYRELAAVTVLFSFYAGYPIQIFAVPAFLFLPADGKFRPTKPPGRWVSAAFYGFYPLHLLCLRALADGWGL